MFSGIVEELGELKNASWRGRVKVLEIKANSSLEGTKPGDSLAVNGVCLTVVKLGPDTLTFEVIPETFRATNLGALKIREQVNLERSLKIGERLCGHFVSGHVDCQGVIRQKRFLQGSLSLEIITPPEFSKYLLPKGSIAIDGISLTLQKIKQNSFFVSIIPHTLKNTTLELKNPSDKVNIEFDLLAKKLSA